MREYWATYSVKDHLAPRAFAADLMLYDRIVVPHPPDDLERTRWADAGWDPDRLDRLLEIIGPDRSRQIPWDGYRQQQWLDRHTAAAHLNRDAFQATRDVLTADLPPYVTGVQADVAFADSTSAEAATGMRAVRAGAGDGMGALATVLGKRFLVPATEAYPDAEGALRATLALTADRDFQRKRRAYWRWQREFLEDCTALDTVWDPADQAQIVAKAVEEMQDLIADEDRALRQLRVKLRALFALTVAGSGLTLAGGGPITPVGLAGAFVTIGSFALDKMVRVDPSAPPPAAFFTSAQRYFGWTGPEAD